MLELTGIKARLNFRHQCVHFALDLFTFRLLKGNNSSQSLGNRRIKVACRYFTRMSFSSLAAAKSIMYEQAKQLCFGTQIIQHEPELHVFVKRSFKRRISPRNVCPSDPQPVTENDPVRKDRTLIKTYHQVERIVK